MGMLSSVDYWKKKLVQKCRKNTTANWCSERYEGNRHHYLVGKLGILLIATRRLGGIRRYLISEFLMIGKEVVLRKARQWSYQRSVGVEDVQ
jgi:hypothetical protein